ncbi:MAG: MarR family transcriptional regulator [Actinomycetota bacterium]
MNKGLKLLDQLVAAGKASVSPAWIVAETGMSPQAAFNMLTRLCRQGLLDRVGQGHYAIRQLGVLGTAASSEDLALAVGALFDGRPHRIAFRSALDHWDVLSHPWNTVQVASPLRLGHRTVSGRPLQQIRESTETVGIGAISEHGGAWVSDLERAILDCAARPRLAGGIDPLGQALASGENIDFERLQDYVRDLDAGPAARRIGSVGAALGLEAITEAMEPFAPIGSGDIDLVPSPDELTPQEAAPYRDRTWHVRWGLLPDELANSVWQ